MRPRDQAKPQERLDPRPEALQNPQVSRPVRGVRPEKRRSNATHTADALNHNLQLVNILNLAESVRDDIADRTLAAGLTNSQESLLVVFYL